METGISKGLKISIGKLQSRYGDVRSVSWSDRLRSRITLAHTVFDPPKPVEPENDNAEGGDAA